jgi:SAM-dependent methyltransferase
MDHAVASTSWPEFYKGRLLDDGYLQYARQRYAPYIAAIADSMKSGDRIVEVGCGLATMTRALIDGQRPFVGFRCFDINPHMVGYARTNLREGYPVEVGDARLPTCALPDIVHSHGMLEHFNDSDIRKVIDAHRADGARLAVHYVPGEKYQKPSFGDERLMSKDAWRAIAAPDEIHGFNDDFDYLLVWRFGR